MSGYQRSRYRTRTIKYKRNENDIIIEDTLQIKLKAILSDNFCLTITNKNIDNSIKIFIAVLMYRRVCYIFNIVKSNIPEIEKGNADIHIEINTTLSSCNIFNTLSSITEVCHKKQDILYAIADYCKENNIFAE